MNFLIKKLTFSILFIVMILAGKAQISGTVYGLENGKKSPLPSANLFWQGTQIGAVTDADGNYTIEKPDGANNLTASFIGFQSETKIIISRQGTVDFVLKSTNGEELEAVDVTGRVDATAVDLRAAELSYKIDEKELRKAACCNLSESFETNASVDVSFTDAVTGQRQIEMLGLSGKYALIQRENIPFARGLNATSGLTYIPGPWVSSLQLTKGLSSVLNGFESITGQINVEFHKPETGPKLLLNGFANQGGRMEINAVGNVNQGEARKFGILAHASTIPFAQDKNGDGFADIPTGTQLNLMPRWHWCNDEKGWEGQLGLSAVKSDKIGGQMDYINDNENGSPAWGFESHGQRYEFFGKTGKVFQNTVARSLGLIYNVSYQSHEGIYGNRVHNSEQKSGYFNAIFTDMIGNTQHLYNAGISVQIDDISESVSEQNLEDNLYEMNRQEIVPGAFVEYTFEPSPKFTLVAGLRGDYNSYFEEFFATPRLHLRYAVSENTTLRAGGGRGQRTPIVMSENLSALASSRDLNFENVQPLQPEIAWNYGASIAQDFPIGNKEIKLTVDGFYTWFKSKLVADLDFDRNAVYFLQPEGSRSFSLLSQIDYEIVKNFNARVAYKYLDAQDNFIEGFAQSYLIPKHRAFLNLAYETENRWKFDGTLNWFGPKNLPDRENPVPGPPIIAIDDSPDFFTVNSQINKEFQNGLEIFVGVDNLLNFKQRNPIVSPENPFGPDFDTNYTWGPIFGRNIYAGVYFTIE